MPQRPNPVPKLPQGGTLQKQHVPHHVGALPDLRDVEDLPRTEPPAVEKTMEAERVLQAVTEGEAGSLPAEAAGTEPFSPPTGTPWGRESPARIETGPVEEGAPVTGQHHRAGVPDTAEPVVPRRT